MDIDYAKLSPVAAPSTLTPEEAAMEAQYMAEHEEAYQRFDQQVKAYEHVIELEDCPLRKQQLTSLLGMLCEDNK